MMQQRTCWWGPSPGKKAASGAGAHFLPMQLAQTGMQHAKARARRLPYPPPAADRHPFLLCTLQGIHGERVRCFSIPGMEKKLGKQQPLHVCLLAAIDSMILHHHHLRAAQHSPPMAHPRASHSGISSPKPQPTSPLCPRPM